MTPLLLILSRVSDLSCAQRPVLDPRQAKTKTVQINTLRSSLFIAASKAAPYFVVYNIVLVYTIYKSAFRRIEAPSGRATGLM